MTKKELVNAIVATSEEKLTQKAVEGMLKTVFDAIADAVVEGDVVRIPEFGSFRAVDTQERTGRNPQTGETMVIPASKRVAFKVSSVLKDKVRA